MIYPCIDLLDGKVVQLIQGKVKGIDIQPSYQQMTELFASNGMKINVIDLNAAMGTGNNLEAIEYIVQRVDARVGGGVRTPEKAKQLMDLGAKKVIAGSSCFDYSGLEYDFLASTSEAIGKKNLIVALDVKDDKVAINGWKETLDVDPLLVASGLEDFCSEIQCTYVDGEGKMQGTDLPLFRALKKRSNIKLTGAGGIRDIKDVWELEKLGANSVIGMAFYTGKISLDEVIDTNQLDFVNGLGIMPAIVQNMNGKVLYLCSQNRNTLQKSIETGKMWRYSASQEREILVGESSGKFEYLKKVYRNCYKDTLLMKVTQEKPFACHEGYATCFYDQMIDGRFKTTEKRLVDPKEVYGGKK
ncbi:hypothetical protein H6503_06355 [Candidatus Woesearchaeota archaeon]|nr:hypothetical protein [Candidatus Woesearchaeota archaeon]